MDDVRTRRPGRGRRGERVFLGVVAGALVLAAGAVVFASLRPYTNAGLSHESSAAPALSKDPGWLQGSAPTPTAQVASSTSSPASALATTQARYTTPTPAAAQAPASNSVSAGMTLPQQMAHLPVGSRQIIIVTGPRIGAKSGTLAIYNEDGGRWVQVLSTAANFGANGLVDGVQRRQGDKQTPTGIWTLGSFLFGQHPAPPAGTKMPYRHVTQSSWWSSEPNATYNTWVNSSAHVSGEHLADSVVQYQYAFNTGFNAPPSQRVIGRGTAIFIHCFEPPGNALGPYTHGCVAIAPSAIVKVFALLDPARHPTCAIGTLAKGTPTSIWAY